MTCETLYCPVWSPRQGETDDTCKLWPMDTALYAGNALSDVPTSEEVDAAEGFNQIIGYLNYLAEEKLFDYIEEGSILSLELIENLMTIINLFRVSKKYPAYDFSTDFENDGFTSENLFELRDSLCILPNDPVWVIIGLLKEPYNDVKGYCIIYDIINGVFVRNAEGSNILEYGTSLVNSYLALESGTDQFTNLNTVHFGDGFSETVSPTDLDYYSGWCNNGNCTYHSSSSVVSGKTAYSDWTNWCLSAPYVWKTEYCLIYFTLSGLTSQLYLWNTSAAHNDTGSDFEYGPSSITFNMPLTGVASSGNIDSLSISPISCSDPISTITNIKTYLPHNFFTYFRVIRIVSKTRHILIHSHLMAYADSGIELVKFNFAVRFPGYLITESTDRWNNLTRIPEVEEAIESIINGTTEYQSGLWYCSMQYNAWYPNSICHFETLFRYGELP